MIISSPLRWCSLGWGCSSVWSECCRHIVLEPPSHVNRVGAEVSRRQGSDEGGQVRPAHQEVAGEYLLGVLVELGLNESDKDGWHVLLGCCLGSQA